jgi:hypothetical protein
MSLLRKFASKFNFGIAIALLVFLVAAAQAARYIINTGTTGNDGTGDTIKVAFDKVNSNFSELYGVAVTNAGGGAGNGMVKSGTNLHFGQSAAYTNGLIPFASGTSGIGFSGNLKWLNNGLIVDAPTIGGFYVKSNNNIVAYFDATGGGVIYDWQVPTTPGSPNAAASKSYVDSTAGGGITNSSPGTVDTLPKWTSTNALGDSRVLDTGLLMSIGYASNSPPNLSGITNSTDVIGIGDSTLDGLVTDGSANIYGYGVSALANATLAPFSGQIFAYGESALSGANLTNAIHMYVFGEGAGAAMTGDGQQSIYAMGVSVLDSASINASDNFYIIGGQAGSGLVANNNSIKVYAFGDNALTSANLDGAESIYAIGSGALNALLSTNSIGIFTIGVDAGNAMTAQNVNALFALGPSTFTGANIDGSDNLFAIGVEALGLSRVTNSEAIFALGNEALRNAVIKNSSAGIYAFGQGTMKTAVIDSSSDIYAIGEDTGANIGLTNKTHIFMLGSFAQATNNNDYVFGDSAYNYFFPGDQATFGGYVRLSGNTNQYTDDGSQLLRNGQPIGTTNAAPANGISPCVTLTYTGTNVTTSSIDWNATNVCYTLLLTNHVLFGDAVAINVPSTANFKWLQLDLIQDSTGGWLVKFTNSIYGGVNGSIPITSNALAWTSCTLINSRQTNGNIMVLPSNFLHR